MKKTFLALLTYLILYSCQKEESKSDFLGNWSSTYDNNTDINITFSSDSILIENLPGYYNRNYSSKWKVIGKKIELEENVLDYKLNPKKDTLIIKNEKDSVYHLKLKRIENNYEFLENKLGFELKIADTNENIVPISNNNFGVNIYIGKQKDTILIKTDEHWGRFGGLERQILDFCYSKNESEIDSLRLNLFVDKSVNDSELDSIKSILRGYPVKRFFRIYNNKEYTKNDWKTEINWLGKYEK